MLPLQTGRQHEPGEENPLQFGLILSTISTRYDDRTQANSRVDCCASVERHPQYQASSYERAPFFEAFATTQFTNLEGVQAAACGAIGSVSRNSRIY
jgi:hypothetical protein